MDVISDQMIDIGLNALGFVAAGGFCTLLYAAILGKRKKMPVRDQAFQTASRENTLISPVAQTSGSESQPEFIDLNSIPSSSGRQQRTVSSMPSGPGEQRRRDRAEIIRIARKMIEAGAGDHKIQATLPLSKGELALLHRDNGR